MPHGDDGGGGARGRHADGPLLHRTDTLLQGLVTTRMRLERGSTEVAMGLLDQLISTVQHELDRCVQPTQGRVGTSSDTHLRSS